MYTQDYMFFISENLKYLMELENCTQKEFAQKWKRSEASISNYIGQTSLIKLDFLTELQNKYKFSIDDFLSKEFKKLERPIESNENYNNTLTRYSGLYSLYYFDTTNHLSSFEDKDNLMYGLLYIYEEKSIIKTTTNKAIAIFGLTYDKLKETWANLQKKNIDFNFVNSFDFGKNTYKYHGNIEVLKDVVSITLNCGNKDSIVYMFKRPGGVNNYIGGMGLSCSISRGIENVPCTQYLASCRGLITSNCGEIADYLSFSSVELHLPLESKKLLRRINDYFNPYESDAFLDIEEKELLVKHNLEQLISDVINNYNFKYEKASHKKDYNWYQYIKKFI